MKMEELLPHFIDYFHLDISFLQFFKKFFQNLLIFSKPCIIIYTRGAKWGFVYHFPLNV